MFLAYLSLFMHEVKGRPINLCLFWTKKVNSQTIRNFTISFWKIKNGQLFSLANVSTVIKPLPRANTIENYFHKNHSKKSYVIFLFFIDFLILLLIFYWFFSDFIIDFLLIFYWFFLDFLIFLFDFYIFQNRYRIITYS